MSSNKAILNPPLTKGSLVVIDNRRSVVLPDNVIGWKWIVEADGKIASEYEPLDSPLGNRRVEINTGEIGILLEDVQERILRCQVRRGYDNLLCYFCVFVDGQRLYIEGSHLSPLTIDDLLPSDEKKEEERKVLGNG